MAVISTNNQRAAFSPNDPLLPWLYTIKKGLDDLYADPSQHQSVALHKLVFDCITTFKNNPQYQNDIRFLRVWFIYMDCIGDFDSVFKEIEVLRICLKKSALYETCATLLEAKGQLIDAHEIYLMGITRNAEPIESLKKAHSLFLERMSNIVKKCSIHQNVNGDMRNIGNNRVDPWSASTTKDVLQKILPRLVKYDGYHFSSRNYPGKVALSALQNSSRNKIIKIGGRDYQIKGCAGQGGFAQVFKAYVNSDPDEIQAPPFPWEFYMYRQLDQRLPNEERSRFGSAQKMHHYSDYSILVCDYLSHGSLQDAINSYVVVGQFMEEVSCIYYTIEMLHILETLHGAGIIHGDFKPDNLLIRNASKDLTVDPEDFCRSRGPWQDQGLCLVDWGRGIDLSLFPAETEFMGDCRTSGFRCVEMQEDKPWKFQVDTYGLCVIVHVMLHNKYMEIEKTASSDGGYYHLPRLPFKSSVKFTTI
ncbi:Mitotic checkpoint serine/threonine-protein kinase BUB1 [Bienertia sinuspersici]